MKMKMTAIQQASSIQYFSQREKKNIAPHQVIHSCIGTYIDVRIKDSSGNYGQKFTIIVGQRVSSKHFKRYGRPFELIIMEGSSKFMPDEVTVPLKHIKTPTLAQAMREAQARRERIGVYSVEERELDLNYYGG